MPWPLALAPFKETLIIFSMKLRSAVILTLARRRRVNVDSLVLDMATSSTHVGRSRRIMRQNKRSFKKQPGDDYSHWRMKARS